MRNLPSSLRVARDVGFPAAIFSGLLVLGVLKPALWVEGETLGTVWPARLYLIGLWLVGAIVAERLFAAVVLDGFAASPAGRPLPRIFHDIVAVIALGIALVGILSTAFHVSLTAFWAASGVIGIVLGIALRPIILDFFSGLGANLERAYNLGDWIALTSRDGAICAGWIEEINWRTLRLRTRDGTMILLPNSILATSAVTNHSMPTTDSRFQIRVRLDVATPVDRAKRVLGSAVNAACSLHDGPARIPAPDIIITDASHEGVEYAIRFWFDPARKSIEVATSIVFGCVLDHLAKAGLGLSHPQQNIFMARLSRLASGFKSVEERMAFLRRVALFDSLSEANLSFLAAELRVRPVGAGQMLVRADDAGDSMFVIAEGVLRVLSKPDSGQPAVELATMQPGQVIGERSMLTGEPRSASITAVTDSIVLEISREDVRQLIEREPGVLAMLERTVSEREASTSRMKREHTGGEAHVERGRAQFLIDRMRQLFHR